MANVDLEGILTEAGVEGVYQRGDEVHGKCPAHFERTGKEDSNPSWSMNAETFVHYCFSCGYRGGLNSLLMELTGEVPVDLEDKLRTDTLISKAKRFREEEIVPDVEEMHVLTEWALANIFEPVPWRLLEMRGLAADSADHFEIRWDSELKQWVLPLRSPHGELLGAQYRQKGSVLTLPPTIKKSRLLFGLKQASPYDCAALVESPLDAVRLHQIGAPAVATLGAFVSEEQIRLMERNFSSVVIALDNDAAGAKAAYDYVIPEFRKRGMNFVMFDYSGLTDRYGDPVKDPGDVVYDDDLEEAWQRTLRG